MGKYAHFIETLELKLSGRTKSDSPLTYKYCRILHSFTSIHPSHPFSSITARYQPSVTVSGCVGCLTPPEPGATDTVSLCLGSVMVHFRCRWAHGRETGRGGSRDTGGRGGSRDDGGVLKSSLFDQGITLLGIRVVLEVFNFLLTITFPPRKTH